MLDYKALGVLFHDVQMARVFPDSKTFADAQAIKPEAELLKIYEVQKNESHFCLKTFVETNFTIPVAPKVAALVENLDPLDHIEALWPILTKTQTTFSLPLPYPFVVPGGRFGEMYYWDSYFTLLGLKAQGKQDMVENMVLNFAHIIDNLGFVPNGTRNYFLSRSQPPFYFLMIDLVDNPLHEKYLYDCLLKEYQFWMSHRAKTLADGTVMNYFGDDDPSPRPESYREDIELAEKVTDPEALWQNLRAACESGWDFSSRWLREPEKLETIDTTNFLPIDLNCLLWGMEQKLIGYFKKSDSDLITNIHTQSVKRKNFIETQCFNKEIGFYTDFDLKTNHASMEGTAAGAYPLYFGFEAPVRQVSDFIEKHLLSAAGLLTTARNTGQQWDAPNCWAPLQWMAIKGLEKMGQLDLANQIKNNWLGAVEKIFKTEHKFTEKYASSGANATGGEYPNQDGFGWTNGVYAALKLENRES